MPDLLRSATPVARKPHRCMHCATVIPAKVRYHRATLKYDGRVYDWITCNDCEVLVAIVWRWVDPFGDEGIGQTEFEDWAREHVDDPEHGEAARALLARLEAATS